MHYVVPVQYGYGYGGYGYGTYDTSATYAHYADAEDDSSEATDSNTPPASASPKGPLWRQQLRQRSQRFLRWLDS